VFKSPFKFVSKRFFGVVALLLLASSALAGSLDQSIKDVQEIRGLQFLSPVKTVSIERDKLPAYLRAQFEKSLPYSFDDYMLLLESLRLVDPDTKNPRDRRPKPAPTRSDARGREQMMAPIL